MDERIETSSMALSAINMSQERAIRQIRIQMYEEELEQLRKELQVLKSEKLELKRKLSKHGNTIGALRKQIKELKGSPAYTLELTEEELHEYEMKRRALNKARRGNKGGEWNRKLKEYKQLHQALIDLGYISAHSWDYKKESLEWRVIRGRRVAYADWEKSIIDYDTLDEEDKLAMLRIHPEYHGMTKEEAECRIMNDFAFAIKAESALAECRDSSIVDAVFPEYEPTPNKEPEGNIEKDEEEDESTEIDRSMSEDDPSYNPDE